MKVNRPMLLGLATALLSMALPLPLATAHICVDSLAASYPQGGGDPVEPLPTAPCTDDCSSGAPGTVHVHIWTDPANPDSGCIGTAGDGIDHCPHASPHSHSYGSGGSAGARSDTASAGRTAGVTTVSETNAIDCDGDGIPGDYDGDWETGVGGGFFGYGDWADEPICQYGLRTHGGTITVNDFVFGNNVTFVIGADDTSGPAIDPVTGECTTDGRITPCDPVAGCGTTGDPDDCLTPVIRGVETNGQGTTCGAGGDGGYWVFLIGARVHETGTGVDVNNPPTTGSITA